MVMQEGRVSVTEREAQLEVAPSSRTVIGLVGTGDGLMSGVLTNNIPRLFNSAAAFITAATPGSGTPTGTLWTSAPAVRSNVNDRIIVVQAESASAAHVGAAIDALETPVSDVLPDIIVAPGHRAATATAAADPVLTALEATAESIDAVFASTIPVTGANKAAQITAAKAYAGANGHTRGVLLFSNGLDGTTAVDISGQFAGALARRDTDIHRGANTRGMVLRGVAGTTPVLSYNFQGRGSQADDVQSLLDSNIVPVIQRTGVQTWGTRFSGYDSTSTSPFKFIGVRRTADQIVQQAHTLAFPFTLENVTSEAPSLIASRLARYMSGLLAIGQVRSFTSVPDPTRNTAASLDAGNFYIIVRFTGAVPTNHVNIVVEAASGTIVS